MSPGASQSGTHRAKIGKLIKHSWTSGSLLTSRHSQTDFSGFLSEDPILYFDV